MATKTTKKEDKCFSYINITLWVIGIGYCTYGLIRGNDPISFLAVFVFALLVVMEVVKLRKGLTDED